MNLHAVQFLEQAVGIYIYIYNVYIMRRPVPGTGNICVRMYCHVCIYMQARFDMLLNVVRHRDVHAQDYIGRAAVQWDVTP